MSATINAATAILPSEGTANVFGPVSLSSYLTPGPDALAQGVRIPSGPVSDLVGDDSPLQIRGDIDGVLPH